MPSPKVDVFRIDLTAPNWAVERCIALLSPDDVQQGNRFRYACDRERYFASHAALRLILSHRLRCAPQQISLENGEFGKPYVTTAPDLQFSLSHSGNLALIAVSETVPVGVDIEMIGAAPPDVPLLFSQLVPSESIALSALAPVVQWTAFLRCWVRKEAVLKAARLGLSRGLREFSVPISDQASDTALIVNFPDSERWSVFDLQLDAGYLAALATKSVGPGCTPFLREFVHIAE